MYFCFSYIFNTRWFETQDPQVMGLCFSGVDFVNSFSGYIAILVLFPLFFVRSCWYYSKAFVSFSYQVKLFLTSPISIVLAFTADFRRWSKWLLHCSSLSLDSSGMWLSARYILVHANNVVVSATGWLSFCTSTDTRLGLYYATWSVYLYLVIGEGMWFLSLYLKRLLRVFLLTTVDVLCIYVDYCVRLNEYTKWWTWPFTYLN